MATRGAVIPLVTRMEHSKFMTIGGDALIATPSRIRPLLDSTHRHGDDSWGGWVTLVCDCDRVQIGEQAEDAFLRWRPPARQAAPDGSHRQGGGLTGAPLQTSLDAIDSSPRKRSLRGHGGNMHRGTNLMGPCASREAFECRHA